MSRAKRKFISLLFMISAVACFDYSFDLTIIQHISHMIGLGFAMSAWELLDKDK